MEEHRLRVFVNRVTRKSYEVTGEWRRLKGAYPYYTPNIIRVKKMEKNEMGGACSMYGIH
jgi:hypothetical protein